MKYSIPKDRILSASHDDDRFDVAAGTPAIDPAVDGLRVCDKAADSERMEYCALGSLMQLLRREKGLTMEKLAEEARVDLSELVGIECDVRYEPKPRTVHQLARVFGLPERELLELSNLTTTHNHALEDAAVRFAAKARCPAELNVEERQALNEFVKFLSCE